MRMGIVHVVGDEARQLHAASDVAQRIDQLVVIGEEMVLQLDPETVAKYVAVSAGRGFGPISPSRERVLRNLAAAASGQCDDALGVRGQVVERDVRVILVIELRPGNDAAQVAVAPAILRQQHEVRLPAGKGLLLDQADLDADNRLDARQPGRVHEAHHTVEAVVIGQGQRRHLQLGGAPDQSIRRGGAIQKAEVAVDVQVDHQSYRRSRNQRSCSR